MRAAILIIGSLLWDNGSRDAWRKSHLRIHDGVHVKAPIRYGRRSSSRGDTFTMTFSLGDALGQAMLVPSIAVIGNVATLLAEATALWKAEQATAEAHRIGAAWGCVGVAFRTDALRAEYAAAWHDNFVLNAAAVWPVSADGILQIPWPVTLTGQRSDVDIILSTATQLAKSPPTAIHVADAWINQHEAHERYFFENVRRGIRTPDDVLIWKRIEECAPRWLTNKEYADAISRLRADAA